MMSPILYSHLNPLTRVYLYPLTHNIARVVVVPYCRVVPHGHLHTTNPKFNSVYVGLLYIPKHIPKLTASFSLLSHGPLYTGRSVTHVDCWKNTKWHELFTTCSGYTIEHEHQNCMDGKEDGNKGFTLVQNFDDNVFINTQFFVKICGWTLEDLCIH